MDSASSRAVSCGAWKPIEFSAETKSSRLLGAHCQARRRARHQVLPRHRRSYQMAAKSAAACAAPWEISEFAEVIDSDTAANLWCRRATTCCRAGTFIHSGQRVTKTNQRPIARDVCPFRIGNRPLCQHRTQRCVRLLGIERVIVGCIADVAGGLRGSVVQTAYVLPMSTGPWIPDQHAS